ncbi:MAG: CPBP family intramembrane metalloprotease [Ruminococcaceae bacterium]|nr:CPBP family intramembrane metalloprotease [Oscillospiraceae bacterium]
MKNALKYIVFLDVIFILLLSLSGFFGGILGYVIYYLAFALPVFLGLWGGGRLGIGMSLPKLKIDRGGLVLTAGAAAPAFALIFFVSWLTSIILSRFDNGAAADVSGNIFLVIFTHAILTAVCEESLFRYIPLAFLVPYSKRTAVIISSLFFALAHCSLYQIPYAFLAGIVFAVLDVAYNSIIPSLILHFGNNLISIIWLRGGGEAGFARIYITVLLSFAVVSLIPMFFMRKKYRSAAAFAFGEDKTEVREFGYAPIVFIVMTLLIAVTSLI